MGLTAHNFSEPLSWGQLTSPWDGSLWESWGWILYPRWGSFTWQLVWKKKLGDEWDSLNTWGPLARVWLEWGGCGQLKPGRQLLSWATHGCSSVGLLSAEYTAWVKRPFMVFGTISLSSSSSSSSSLLLMLVKAGVKAKASRTSQQPIVVSPSHQLKTGVITTSLVLGLSTYFFGDLVFL